MNSLNQTNYRKGSIIVITLILLLVMTTMGMGLFYSAKQTAKQVSSSIDKRNLLYTAESCITEAVNWLKSNYSDCKGEGSVCKTFTTSNGMNKWDIGESDKRKVQMSSQDYKCEIQKIKELNLGGGNAQAEKGFNIGQGEGYGAVATSTKNYYKIKSNGFKAQGDSKSTVEVIVSIIL
jgi:type IV pilus assembly protein PilX